jgi:hypothetical protein
MNTLNSAPYDGDIIAWANEQARLLRAGLFSSLDIEHIAEEIEDVGKSERRELENRMAVLLTHLLKWQHQPERQGNSWRRTIKTQRAGIAERLRKTPSLRPDFDSELWRAEVWADALTMVTRETGLSFEAFPEDCPWTIAQILNPEWLPDCPHTV